MVRVQCLVKCSVVNTGSAEDIMGGPSDWRDKNNPHGYAEKVNLAVPSIA